VDFSDMYYLCFDENKDTPFVSAGRFISQNLAPHPDRTLDTAVLLLGYGGECPLAQDGREYVIKKGTFALLFPNTRHHGTGAVSEGQSHFWCHFYLPDGYYIAEADDAEALRRSGACVIPEFSEIDDCEKFFILFSQLIDESEREGARSAITDAYVKILLCSLSDSVAASKNDEHKLVSAIKAWANKNAARGGGVVDVARELGYAPDYLTRVFKKQTGTTTLEYLNSVRLQKAKNMLLNTDMTISQIAYAVGFADEKYFMRLFRRRENVTPTKYRTSHEKKHLN
jgi:AraC-like DNA-binding protein